MFKQLNNKIKQFRFHLSSRLPHVPDFREPINLIRFIVFSMFFILLFSLLRVNYLEEVYREFLKNFVTFSPYIFTQIMFLLICSSVLIKAPKWVASFVVILSNFLAIVTFYWIGYENPFYFFYMIDSTINSYVITFLLTIIFLIYVDWKEKVKQPAELSSKLLYLQSRLKPHFLFNTINSINYMIKKDQEKASKMIINLASLLRVSLKEKDIYSTASLNEEIELATKYLEIEQIRLGENRLRVKWDIQNDQLLRAKVPDILLQPLVENAVLHGIQTIEEGGEIEIKISENLLNFLIIEIKNPVGVSHDFQEHHNFSLRALNDRLNIYYEGLAEAKVNKGEDYFYLFIKMPFILE